VTPRRRSTAGRHTGLATLFAALYAALIVYASLYPFEDWRWAPGQDLWSLLKLPSSAYHGTFDVVSNLLGYLPLGLLVAVVAQRQRVAAIASLLVGALACVALSYGSEVAQAFVPGRVPSLEDFLLNSAGGLAGAASALAVQRAGLAERWGRLRARWFAGDAAVALALLLLWPVGLLFPAPVPLGLGQVGERLREVAAAWLADVPWASDVHALLAASAAPATPLRPLGTAMIVALGLLAPCAVAYAVAPPGWRRLPLAAAILAAGFVGMTLSTLLNFGPAHALAWLAPGVALGLLLGTLLALLATPLPRRLVLGAGLMVITGLVLGVAQAPDDPYFAHSLQAWEQGRFVRFHGLAQWVGWLWPYAALAWLLARLASAQR
jgi:VanZ family protein